MRYECSCCGNYTLREESDDICRVCLWQEDIVQREDPKFGGGPNYGVSLNQARENYKEFGVSSRRFMDMARKPSHEELPENN